MLSCENRYMSSYFLTHDLSQLGLCFMRREPFIHGLFEKRNHLLNLFVAGRQYLAAIQAAKTDFAINELCLG